MIVDKVLAFIAKHWKIFAFVALLAVIAILARTAEARKQRVGELEATLKAKNEAIKTLVATVNQRDDQLKSVGKQGGLDYAALSKQCAADAPEWFNRGVAVGRGVCAAASRGPAGAATNSPAGR